MFNCACKCKLPTKIYEAFANSDDGSIVFTPTKASLEFADDIRFPWEYFRDWYEGWEGFTDEEKKLIEDAEERYDVPKFCDLDDDLYADYADCKLLVWGAEYDRGRFYSVKTLSETDAKRINDALKRDADPADDFSFWDDADEDLQGIWEEYANVFGEDFGAEPGEYYAEVDWNVK